jgi:hypothetical protein
MSGAALSFFETMGQGKDEPTQASSEQERDPLAQRGREHEIARGEGRGEPDETMLSTETKAHTKKRTFAEANFRSCNRPVTVNVQELAGKVRSKHEIYKLLTEQCKWRGASPRVGQYYLPPEDQVTMPYLAAVLAGEKKVSPPGTPDARVVPAVPRHEASERAVPGRVLGGQPVRGRDEGRVDRALSARAVQQAAQPRVPVHGKHAFAIDPHQVINSLRPEYFAQVIKQATKRRLDKGLDRAQGIVILPQILEEIREAAVAPKSKRHRACDLV